MGGEFYYYNKRGGSITTSSVRQKNYEDMVKINLMLLQESINYNIDTRKAFRNIYKSYLMLMEEIYYLMSSEDRKKERMLRKNFLINALKYTEIIGTRNKIITLFPHLFYCIRQFKRKFKRR